MIHDPYLKSKVDEAGEPTDTDQPDGLGLGYRREMPDEQSNPEYKIKDSKKRQDYLKETETINKYIRNYEINMTKDKIHNMLNEELFFYERGLSHKKHFAKEIIENLDFMKADEVLVSTFIDPKFFYIDQSLTDENILEFHNSIENTFGKNFDKITVLTKLMERFDSHSPDIQILLKKGFGSDVPGFIGVDYQSSFEEFITYVNENFPIVLSEKKEY